MDDILKLTLLYDYYGELLTDKQKKFFELHYYDDLSFREIGDLNGITRQTVFDIIKRSKNHLELLEDKLKLVNKHLLLQNDVNTIKDEVNKFITTLNYLCLEDNNNLKNNVLIEIDKIKNNIDL